MKSSWRHIVSATVTICIVMSSAFVCAPAVAAVEGHCKPAATMQAGCSHCAQKNVMDCCATSAPDPSSVPQESQQQGTRLVPTTSPAPADAGAVLAPLPSPAVAPLFRAAPAHGYRSTDLPILNAVFLI
jgi:hypothetical protein